MKLLTTIAAMMISLTAFGQDTLKSGVSTEFKRFLFGVNISPDYCYRTLKNNNGSSSSSMIIELRNKSEEPKFSYSAGLNICHNISKHFGIELGVQYSEKGYVFRKTDLFFNDVIDPRYGFVYTSNGTPTPTKAKLIFNYIYIDVPLRAIFSFGNRRMHFVTSIGITTNIFLKATQTSIIEFEDGDTKRQTQEQPYDFKTVNFSPTVSVGCDYRISNKINLRAEPTFRYGLLRINDAPIIGYLWGGGLNLTCYYSLK